jgi:hypothetical protein
VSGQRGKGFCVLIFKKNNVLPVPESLKNVLLVLFDAKLLEEGKPLAVLTWDRVAKFKLSVNLREEVLREIHQTKPA